MHRHVKGSLFADYVRMIRANKSVQWLSHLEPDDFQYIDQRIDPDGWYPMSTFERLGNAILAEVARGDLSAVRAWGRFSVDQLLAKYPDLVSAGDPIETLMRFRVMRSTFFDFPALTVTALHEGHAEVAIHYGMGARAEEAASHQTMGFFERQLELAGATNVTSAFRERSWAGDPRTVLTIHWR